MKLWIDDVRPVPRWDPPGTWTWVKTPDDALQWLEKHHEIVTHISFDHDLGQDPKTGLAWDSKPVALKIEELAALGKIKKIVWSVHSMNPIGRRELFAILLSADRFWDMMDVKNDT